MRLILPYPPSINRYWRSWQGRVLISADGRRYRQSVAEAVAIARAGGHLPKTPMDGRISVRVDAAPPDRRVRDLDNISKALLDALTHAGVWRDDSQIDDLRIVRCDPERGGCVVVYAVPAGARSRIMSIGEKEAA